MMRILHLCFGGVGGHRSVVRSIVDHDDENDNHVLFLGREDDVDATVGAWKVPVNWVPVRRRGDLRSMIDVAAITRRARPDVSVCHSHRHLVAVFFGMVFAGRLPRIILAEHQPNHLRSRLDEVWSFIGIRLSSSVVFLTPDQSREYPLRRLLAVRRLHVETIPNGVLLPVAARPTRVRSERRITLGVSGRLIPHKDIETLLRALALHAGSTSDVEANLRIAGDGPTLEHLRVLVLELGIADRVHFLGALSPEQMLSFYASLDAYVHPSQGETLSMSLLEAAATGLPIIATAVPGITDLLTDEVDSLLVPVSDPAALASAIVRLQNPGLRDRLGSSARDLVREHYSSEVTAVGYQRLFARMIDSRT